MINLNNLKAWAEKVGGSCTTSSTIALKANDIDLVVHGTSIEEALMKLSSALENPTQQGIPPNNPQNSTSNIMQNPIQVPMNSPINTFTSVNPMGNNSPQDLNKLLAGRRIVRIADNSPLKANEQIMEFNGQKYVVANDKL